MDKYQAYLDFAAAQPGVVEARVIDAGEVVFDPRTLLKCMYGCTGWNNCWVCPSAPGGLRPWEAEPIFRRYQAAVVIHSRDKNASQKASFALESKAFVDGFYFAFSLSDCGLCPECSYRSGDPCRFPKQARPAAQGVGIDVFATVRKLGLPLRTLAGEEEEQNWYSFVFLE